MTGATRISSPSRNSESMANAWSSVGSSHQTGRLIGIPVSVADIKNYILDHICGKVQIIVRYVY